MYYTAKVEINFEDDKGRPKKKTETYLVQAESVTDAEAIVHEQFANSKLDFEVKGVNHSRIIDVFSASK